MTLITDNDSIVVYNKMKHFIFSKASVMKQISIHEVAHFQKEIHQESYNQVHHSTTEQQDHLQGLVEILQTWEKHLKI